MATPTVSNAFVTQYDDLVHLTYQRQGAKLANTVRKKPGVVGQVVRFQKITTEAEAEEKSRHGDIPVQELTHAYSDITITNYYAAFYADEDDLEKLNIDERKALASSGAWCVGRKHDDLLIDAMETTTTTTGDYSTAMTLGVVLAAFDELNKDDVPDDGMRFGVISTHAYAELLCYEQFSSSDWVGADGLPWKSGLKYKSWLGVNWIAHSGLPLASTDNRDCYMYHKSAVGWGENHEIRSRIEWDVRKDAWLIKSKIAGAACLIDTEGVVEMRVDDDTAISTEMEKLIAAT